MKVYLDQSLDGDLVLPIPEDMLTAAGLEEGEVVVWTDNKDGTYTLQRGAYVLVETVQLVRHQYIATVPAQHPEYALDSVTCQELSSISKKYLDETIVSHRVLTNEEYGELTSEE